MQLYNIYKVSINMKNRTIAIKVKQIVPWWECDGDIYKQTMELLESNNKQLYIDLLEFIKDYYNSKTIVEELEKRIKEL